MNEELLASIDDRLMQLVEEMKLLTKLMGMREVVVTPEAEARLVELTKAILPALASRASVAPTTPSLGAATDNAPHYGKPTEAASVPYVDKVSRGEPTRRLGLSPEKKRYEAKAFDLPAIRITNF